MAVDETDNDHSSITEVLVPASHSQHLNQVCKQPVRHCSSHESAKSPKISFYLFPNIECDFAEHILEESYSFATREFIKSLLSLHHKIKTCYGYPKIHECDLKWLTARLSFSEQIRGIPAI